jgi:hypothetical protein
MKTITLATAALLAMITPVAAQEIQSQLKPFNRVIVSPHVNLVLKRGDQESIRLVYEGVDAENINIKQHGHTLHIYLDRARFAEKTNKHGYTTTKMYPGARLTAYVTYRSLEELEIRGSQELTCLDPIRSQRFALRAYGENDITFASLNTEYFITRLYGENTLKIEDGKADFQKYSLYGENDINTVALKSYSATANLFGESSLQLHTDDELKVSSFGEGEVLYAGNAQVNHRLVFGNARVSHLD